MTNKKSAPKFLSADAQKSTQRNKKLIIILAAVLVLCAVAAAIFFFFLNGGKEPVGIVDKTHPERINGEGERYAVLDGGDSAKSDDDYYISKSTLSVIFLDQIVLQAQHYGETLDEELFDRTVDGVPFVEKVKAGTKQLAAEFLYLQLINREFGIKIDDYNVDDNMKNRYGETLAAMPDAGAKLGITERGTEEFLYIIKAKMFSAQKDYDSFAEGNDIVRRYLELYLNRTELYKTIEFHDEVLDYDLKANRTEYLKFLRHADES